MTIAIYAGTFDPFTLGHEDVLDRARQIFDEVIVAVAADTGRNTFFSFNSFLSSFARLSLSAKTLCLISRTLNSPITHNSFSGHTSFCYFSVIV